MSSKVGELRANNTSGVPGLRLARRRGHLVIDVAWWADKRCSTSYPVGSKPVKATERALERREAETGTESEFSAQRAWLLLRRNAPARLFKGDRR